MTAADGVSTVPRPGRPRLWPWAVALVVTVVGVAGTLLPVFDPTADAHPAEATATVLLLVSSFAAGATLLARRPDHPVSWLLWLPGLFFGLEAVAELVERGVGDGSLLLWSRWASDTAFAVSMPPLLIFLPLLFPTGRPPSRAWRWVLWTGSLSVVLMTFGNATAAPAEGEPARALVLDGPLPELAATVGGVLMAVSFIGAAASAIVRLRRATGIERQQLRLFGWGAAVAPFGWAAAIVTEGGPHGQVGHAAMTATLALLPVAVAVAVLRYRLYDIDRVVSRTLSWTVLTALLAAVYAGVVVTAQMLVGRDVPDLVIAVATLAAAALFQPLRARVQAVVDRRFNRARYDAEATVAAFGQQLRDQFVPDQVQTELLRTVQRAVAPQHVGSWTARVD